MYNPYNFQNQFDRFTQMQQQMQQPQQVQQLIQVSGLEGAKAFQMPPNSSVALFSNTEDLLYVKSTDGAGFGSIRTFALNEVLEQKPKEQNYVTREEFESLKEELKNGKQFISKQTKSVADDK